jgi:hypothetical protein
MIRPTRLHFMLNTTFQYAPVEPMPVGSRSVPTDAGLPAELAH